MDFYTKYNELSGESVRLEPIDESHIEGLFEAGKTQSDWEYLPIPGFSNIDEVKAWYHQAKKLLEAGMHYTYVLIEPDTNEVIGSSRYMNFRARDLAVEIGYTWVGSKFQRTSVNTEAKLLLLSNAFEGMNANRVELKTDARNIRSQNAIERVGGIKEGVLRNHMVAQGGFVRDTVMYSVIKSEWPGVKENLIGKLSNYA